VNSERLYIIGNGFDRYHGIASDYRNFAAYLAQTDHTVHRLIGEYFAGDAAFWAEFETRLAEFDADQAVDYASQFLDDKGYGDFQFELEQIGTALSSTLTARFGDWIRSLAITERGSIAAPLNIDVKARFLSFNYTPTLERIYGVPRDSILHIHGYAAEPGEPLVLGHGWERRPEDSLNFQPDGPDDDWRVRQGIEHIDDFFAATFKPAAKLIAQNRLFFEALANVREIFIMGHSLAEVDNPYLEAIMDRIDLKTTQWTISVFNDLDERRSRFGAFGIAPHLVSYKVLSAF
jgi:hypothetical protein